VFYFTCDHCLSGWASLTPALQIVGSANGLQGSVVAVSDVNDRLEIVSQPYDAHTTRIIDSIERFRRSCSTYKVNMFTSLFPSPPNNDDWTRAALHILQCESKNPPEIFWHFFPNGWEFGQNFTRLLYVPIYAKLLFFIQLSATLMKLCHIKRDRHHMLKMSTIGRNARWVVALNMV